MNEKRQDEARDAVNHSLVDPLVGPSNDDRCLSKVLEVDSGRNRREPDLASVLYVVPLLVFHHHGVPVESNRFRLDRIRVPAVVVGLCSRCSASPNAWVLDNDWIFEVFSSIDACHHPGNTVI